MGQSLKEATTYIEQGHVRVGPNVITDPAYLVSRTFEDYVTWVDSSKIKRTIMKYNDQLDDFDLLGNWILMTPSAVEYSQFYSLVIRGM